jgi:hypothetical protein
VLFCLAEGKGAASCHPEDMEQAVSIINKGIQEYNMEIRCAYDEITIKKYYLLISTVENISRYYVM